MHDHRGNETNGEQIHENEVTSRREHKSAFREPGLLVLPVIEGRGADHQVERTLWIRQVLGKSPRKDDAGVVGPPACHRDHSLGRIDPGQLFRLRKTLGQDFDKEAGAASDIEYPARAAVRRESQVGRTNGDLVVHPTEPPLLVVWCPFVKRLDIPVASHRPIVVPRTLPPRARAWRVGSKAVISTVSGPGKGLGERPAESEVTHDGWCNDERPTEQQGQEIPARRFYDSPHLGVAACWP